MTQNIPVVSIIMNCFNSDRFLTEAIDSIYSQTFFDWEIIFWDNASTDGSSEIANSYDQRLHYFRFDKTTPLGEARLAAMEQANGKYIAFLDCDDIYLSHKLQTQVSLMEDTNYGMCYGSAINIGENGKTISRALVKYKSGFVFPDLLKRYEINMQSAMVRRSILDKFNVLFSTNLVYCPDYNLFMELASRVNIGVINECVVKYRIVSNSLSSRTVHLAANEIKYTLDAIRERDPALIGKYRNQFNIAYDKVNFYEAVNMIYQHNFKKARKYLKPIVIKKWQYMILYILLLVPVPSKFILRVLNR